MAAESAFGGPRQIVASGETVKRPADLRPLRHRNRHSQRVRQLCPENCADTLETEADFGGDRTDDQRGADDQIVEAGVWGNWRKVVEGLRPKRRVIDRFDERYFAYPPFVESDDRRLQLTFKTVDFAPREHYALTIVRYRPVETRQSARGGRGS